MINDKKMWRSPAGQAVVRAYAIHEAGHAVGRWYLDRTRFVGRNFFFPELRHVMISREGEPVKGRLSDEANFGGVCSGDPCTSPDLRSLADVYKLMPTKEQRRRIRAWRQMALADIIYTMAGPIAEEIHRACGEEFENAGDWLDVLGDEVLHDECEGEGTDWWQVMQRIPLLGRRWRLHLDRAFELADRVVRDHQQHVEALADALVDRGLVEGDDVMNLFDRIGPPRHG